MVNKPSQEILDMFSLSDSIRKAEEISERPIYTTIEIKDESKLGEEGETIPVVFGGKGILVDGDKISKTSMLKALEIDSEKYSDLKMTKDEALRVTKSIHSVVHGGSLASTAMICRGSKCHYKETCLTGDTLILMLDGSYKKLIDLKTDDKIWGFSPSQKQMSVNRVIFGRLGYQFRGVKPVYLIETEHGHSIKATADHLFYSKIDQRPFGYNCIEAGIQPGSKLIFTDGFYNKKFEEELDAPEFGDCFITKVTKVKYAGEEPVYDFTAVGYNNFFANGLLVHNCELYINDKAPIGRPCLYEAQYIREMTSRYIEEFGVTGEKASEMKLIEGLVELDVYDRRATMKLALEDQGLDQEDIVGFDESGRPIIKTDISRFLSIKERNAKQRHKILEALMATRKERAKVVAQVASSENAKAGVDALRNTVAQIIAQNRGTFTAQGLQDEIDGKTIKRHWQKEGQ